RRAVRRPGCVDKSEGVGAGDQRVIRAMHPESIACRGGQAGWMKPNEDEERVPFGLVEVLILVSERPVNQEPKRRGVGPEGRRLTNVSGIPARKRYCRLHIRRAGVG